ncbi:hypothetical protein GEOBRER4_n0077 [Citrifermentans bremense]|uniref:Uncharacterized protein n=1 Tax=Citrifermentans bremense TaxID=60035 RepID=A0A6S6M155_9BACT|nr:hypothetical protein [Citrifermentans bremense]BCG45324.1 hypothetical protein GEOBRER4_n0077 [Citrifermentans bremense]
MRMRLLRTITLCFALLVPVLAQGELSNVHQSTTTPSEARYEIIQSQLAARWTFRLDRYNGEVMQLLLNKEKENVWEKVMVVDLPRIKAPIRPRFQIFTSGLAARHTFLLDTVTGKTWTLIFDSVPTREGEAEAPVFKPFM